MQIKDLAIGDGFVYLMEGSSKVKFYVLAHNYESGLNGRCFAGRVRRRAESDVKQAAAIVLDGAQSITVAHA